VVLCFIETKVNREGLRGRRVERGRERKRDNRGAILLNTGIDVLSVLMADRWGGSM
jgi:hypothetical protein